MVNSPNCFIIAEAGVNHNGSEELAIKLVEVAAKAGADAVKFQSFRAEALAKPGTQLAEYQKKQTGGNDQFSMLQSLELSPSLHKKLKKRCDELDIEFMSTPFDEQSADFLLDLGVKRLKLPSGEITNFPLISHLAKSNIPLIISTGMSTLEEVQEAVQCFRETRESCQYKEPLPEKLTLLHCTSNYPALPKDVNLRAMHTLKNKFNLPVGYSDHTEGIFISAAAVALGAKIVEKHFTLDRSLPGPDHSASLEPSELIEMIKNIRSISNALGDGIKAPCESELPIRSLVRKSITLNRELKAGEKLDSAMLVLLRPGNGIPPKEINKVVNLKVRNNLPQWHTLQWTDLET